MNWLVLPDDASRDELDRAGAAVRQHECAVAIRAAIASQFESVQDYADWAGIKYARLNSLLNGAALMRFEDVANAERNLGLSLWRDPDLWAGVRL